MDPDNWNTLNPNTAILGVLTCLKATGADAHSGNSAIKLITKSVLGQNANGIATTGTITISPPGVSGGVPYTGRPDSIAGWYKYTSVGSDNGFVELLLLGAASATDTVGFVRFQTPASTVGTYTHFSAAVNYVSVNPVAKSIWLLSSSAGFTAVVNSTLFVDDLELITNSGASVNELASAIVSLAPNPVSTELTIMSEKSLLQFSLYDSYGQMVLQNILSRGKNSIDLSALADGIYFYSSLDSEKNKMQKGKIVVAHH
jgi:hypothetical protein